MRSTDNLQARRVFKFKSSALQAQDIRRKASPPVGNEVLVRHVLQERNFHESLLKPTVIIADRYSLACKLSQINTIQDMLHEEYCPLPTATQFLLGRKEPVEVALSERTGRDSGRFSPWRSRALRGARQLWTQSA